MGTFMGTSLGPNMLQHFSSIFKPHPSNEEAIDQARSGLSLLTGQGSQVSEATIKNLPQLHQIDSLGLGTQFTDPFVSCSNPIQSDYQSWVLGSKHSSTNTGELTSTSLPLGNTKEVGSPQLASAPSLYSTQHQHHQPPPANMSATALLQKAAQIGATWTEPSFHGSVGVKYNSKQVQDENRYNGLFGPNPTPINLETNLDSSMNNLSTLNQLQMYPRKRPNTQKDDIGEQTRDFLGVGVQTICPSSINGWI